MDKQLIVDILVTDLRALITDLGRDGGLLSPSIYDTAQVLRLSPQGDHVWSAVNWLLEQQHPDGGWGDPLMPRRRAVPTLAALLALRPHCTRRTAIAALDHATTFLLRQRHQWSKSIPYDRPVRMELIWPYLLEQAVVEENANEAWMIASNIPLKRALASYHSLRAGGERQRAAIRALNPGKGTPPVYGWEAWGLAPTPTVVDATGGVGHSPAATAAWIHKALNDPTAAPHLSRMIHEAHDYLGRASRATSEHIPGLYPTVWPITRFEQSLSLYAFVAGGILGFSPLQNVLTPHIHDLSSALASSGIGFIDDGVTDATTTIAAIAVLSAAGVGPDCSMLHRFATNAPFAADGGMDQSTLVRTAHAVHALTIAGHDASQGWSACIQAQQRDGTWVSDTWNTSWLYTTAHMMIALKNAPYAAEVRNAIDALRVNQFSNGGWGSVGHPTTVETAYAVLALHSLRSTTMFTPEDMTMLSRGYNWLLTHYRPFRMKNDKYWLRKEIYCPQRIDRAYELSALLAVTLADRP